jgi:hypothetical protein
MGAAAGLAAGDAAVVVVVVAGDTAATGVMPTAGEIPGTAGVVARAGAVAAAAGLAGAVPGGGGGDTWAKEVHARVTEQRLAISSVFIGLIGKFLSRLEIPILIPVCLSSMR